MCREHPEEEVQYFCFDCNVPPVCPECVIHGEHRGCNVQLLKKAYPTIEKTIDELQIQIKGKVDELDIKDKRIASRKREVHEPEEFVEGGGGYSRQVPSWHGSCCRCDWAR